MPIQEQELIDAGLASELVTDEQLDSLRSLARERGWPLVQTVSSQLRIPLKAFYHAAAQDRGIQFVDLSAATIQESAVEQLAEVALQRGIVPVVGEGGGTLLATADVDDLATISAVERSLDTIAEVALATPQAVEDAVKHMRRLRQPDWTVEDDAEEASALLDRIVNEAYLQRASDIHLEPMEHGIQIRLRVDGRLQVYLNSVPGQSGRSLLSRIKVLAGMDIAEQRAPQDGRIRYELQGESEQDMRVAVIPTRYGERATLRLLGTTDQVLTLETLGMLEDDLADFRQGIERPYGVIFLTGPTGSGKSTTLYSALKEINTGWRNIVTVEDPIEQVVAGISQVQVGASDKVTFHSALRALLRHDPDVLMVGEVRDLDTADTALKAALTGHLVLSSLHTNTAAGAIARLVDFGCEPYLVGATLVGAVSQRLVRRLCGACREPVEPTAEERQLLEGADVEAFYRPVGCPQCLGNGYAGRIGLFECFWIDDGVRRQISNRATEADIVAAAEREHRSMFYDGLRKVGLGLTTLSEVVRVTRGEVS